MPTVPTPDDIQAFARDRSLARRMSRRFNLSQTLDLDAVIATCVTLHEDGQIDLFALVEDGDIPGLESGSFFLAAHFLCSVLLLIDAPVERMMQAIDVLVTRGGNDLAASEPNGTFRSWCERDPARPEAVIRAARDRDPLSLKFLTFALEASRAMREARALALSGSPEERLSAVTALSRMPHPDPADVRETLLTFRSVAETDTADNARANTLHAFAALLTATKTAVGPEELHSFTILLTAPGEYTLHQAAGVLWRFPETLSPQVVSLLLTALAEVNPGNLGTIKDLDLGLERLLASGYHAEAIAFLRGLLDNPESSLDLGAFETSTHALASGAPERLSLAVTTWLIEGSRNLCEGLSRALGSLDRDQPIGVAAGDVFRPPAELGLLCERAIGFLFLQPTAAASILIAVLRSCPADMGEAVEDLLVETLLLNYGGVRGYLEGLEPTDAAKAYADAALTRNQAYLDALRAVPDLAELRPSEHHREIERLRMSDQMQKAFKEAQRESVLLNLVTRSVILHGNGALTFVTPPNAERRALEMDLHSHGVSFEMPRLEVVDPVGLDYMLRVLRNRRRDS
jgi:hypothetical protein